ncbi:DUF7742 family protein [Roseisalinus antarcticus]|uniref:DUF7742 domain-containing protein n=1 Tax=Roseisalinus antarcticus TaxID=254357 RepID=A0A1Y5T5A8_9RHOB|nr:hypothetical protein ROA7023_02436 [Roseisalinus antarcticus]
MMPSDLDMAVRVLLAVPADQRRSTAWRLVARARIADAFRRQSGRIHHEFGTGTILASAMGFARADLPDTCDGRYRSALAVFLEVCRVMNVP